MTENATQKRRMKMTKQQVKQAVVFPADRELSKLRKENAIMMDALKRIQSKPYFPPHVLIQVTLQSCIHIAEEAIDEIEGD